MYPHTYLTERDTEPVDNLKSFLNVAPNCGNWRSTHGTCGRLILAKCCKHGTWEFLSCTMVIWLLACKHVGTIRCLASARNLVSLLVHARMKHESMIEPTHVRTFYLFVHFIGRCLKRQPCRSQPVATCPAFSRHPHAHK